MLLISVIAAYVGFLCSLLEALDNSLVILSTSDSGNISITEKLSSKKHLWCVFLDSRLLTGKLLLLFSLFVLHGVHIPCVLESSCTESTGKVHYIPFIIDTNGMTTTPIKGLKGFTLFWELNFVVEQVALLKIVCQHLFYDFSLSNII